MFDRFASKAAIVTLSAAAAFVNVAVAAPAQAADLEGRSAVVSYADLDLTTASGAETLHRRIAGAASQVCGTADPRQLKEVAMFRTCRTAAIASAEPQVKLVLAMGDTGAVYADAGTIKIVAN